MRVLLIVLSWIRWYIMMENFKKEISYEELVSGLANAIHHFAKRQLTWFKKRSDIIWIKDEKEAIDRVREFLK